MKIKIIQTGEIQPNLLDIIAETLNKRFKNKYYVGDKVAIPKDYYNKFKEQHDAGSILSLLGGYRGDGKVIGVTSNDLYYGDLNFVFGVADKDMCLVSTARLDPKFYTGSPNFELLLDRTRKEIIREVGGMFGLKDCGNPSCVMHPCKSVSYLDDKKDNFCKECTLKISMEDIRI